MKLFISLISVLILFSFNLSAQDDAGVAAIESHARDHAAGVEFARKAQEEAIAAANANANSPANQQAELTKQMLIIKENQEKAEKMMKEMEADQ
jgi:hypothetical protein